MARICLGRIARYAIVTGLVGLSLGCGGGNGGTSVDPNAPVIANLVTVFLGACQTGAGPGRGRRLTMNFTDADANIPGGRATIRAQFDGGSPIVVDIPIPSGAAQISGTSAGTIALFGCARFGSNSTLVEAISVTDATGKTSNELTATTSRPPGFPELPSPTAPPVWDALDE